MAKIENYQELVNDLYKAIEDNGGAESYFISIRKKTKGVYPNEGKWVTLKDATETEPAQKGYAPTVPVIRESSESIFEQTVTELDLTEVVKAVNGIKD